MRKRGIMKKTFISMLIVITLLVCNAISVFAGEKLIQIHKDTETATDLDEDIEKFPESYRKALYELKAKHPSWKFEMYDTGLDWNSVVALQNKNRYSLLPIYFPEEYILKDTADGAGWCIATVFAIEHYMDPRNWLTEDYIFQFEKLTYMEQYQTFATVVNLLKDTFMKAEIPGYSNGVTYPQAFYDIGGYYGVSPLHLASRVVQEQGRNGTSDNISGTYPGYEGLYNYFNIKATGSTPTEITINALKEAREEGWTERYVSLLGGSGKVADRILKKGQITNYLQKFDLVGISAGRSPSQYMQNLAAPSNEGLKVKKTYASCGAMDSPFVFYIPVFRNMPGSREENISKYVDHLYSSILGRECSDAENKTWSEALVDKNITVVDAICGFLGSDEYIARNTSDEEYIVLLYSALFEREASAEEIDSWLVQLEGYYSRVYILQKLTSSEEFKDMCERKDVEKGEVTVNENELFDDNLLWFIVKLYENVLNRSCTMEEVQYHYSAINEYGIGCAEVALSFFSSEEYVMKHTTDEEYINTLFKSLLVREASTEDISLWNDIFAMDYSRKFVFKQVVDSEEFLSICEKYNIIKGGISLSEDEVYTDATSLYIEKAYVAALNRKCSDQERAEYLEKLNNTETTWSAFLYDIIFGEECNSINRTNEEYISMLYRVLFNREATADDIAYWTSVLEGCYSRKYVFSQMISSDEFVYMCQQRHIIPGTFYVGEMEKYEDNVAWFVSRLYERVLNRGCSNAERRDWSYAIKNYGLGCANVAYSFVSSDEYIYRGTTNREYVNMLYWTLLNRECREDEAGFWVNPLDSGYSRKFVFCQIIQSSEFIELCNSLGLPIGEVSLGDDEIYMNN